MRGYQLGANDGPRVGLVQDAGGASPQSGSVRRSLARHSESVTAAAWLPDGQHFVTASLDKAMHIWVGLASPAPRPGPPHATRP